MKNLNKLIDIYNSLLLQGELQLAYRGILGFINQLRIDISKRHPDYIVGSLYQWKMDLSFFSITTKFLQENMLKNLFKNGSRE